MISLHERGATSRALARVTLLGLLSLASTGGAAEGAELPDPWSSLVEARESLESGPLIADFVQTYVPAGFSSGERETGRILLDLPSCLQWNYEIPDEKRFLFCEDEVWYWNHTEPGGRHYTVDPEAEPGLDLLLLEVERLRERYAARADDAGNGRLRIELVPLEPEFGVTPASLTIETGTRHLVVVDYSDSEGNTTRFEISGYRPGEGAGRLSPPADIEWTDE